MAALLADLGPDNSGSTRLAAIAALLSILDTPQDASVRMGTVLIVRRSTTVTVRNLNALEQEALSAMPPERLDELTNDGADPEDIISAAIAGNEMTSDAQPRTDPPA
jgi:hypothetical protein